MQSFENKICLITGATSGIGKAAALKLAKLGASLVLIGRNADKGRIICDQIKKETNNKKIEFYKLDLSLMKEVSKSAKRIKSDYEHIDILINNAGARFLDHIISKEGIEQTLAVNHLSHFLLTNLLINTLKKSSAATIVNISSGVHYSGNGIIENITNRNEYDGRRQYANSKLANVLFTYELADRLKNIKVTANAVDPGGVATNFARNNGLINWLKHRIYYLMKGNLLTPEQGAETIIYLATSPSVEGITGKYFKDKKAIKSSSISYDLNMARKLWEASEKIIVQQLGEQLDN
ncbi:MAG TPA: SDR family NAD(P)-dependent oxidoreductase [Syntrophales bacterium]|nr:SDR family NAD(P)-dependent oxidoreductase [Syntrophales bacterium]